MSAARFVALLLPAVSATWTIQRIDANQQYQECTTSGDNGYLCCSASQSGSLAPTNLCLDTDSGRVTMDAGSYGYYKISLWYDGSAYYGYFDTTGSKDKWPLWGGVEEVTGSNGYYTLCHSGSQCCSGASIDTSCTTGQMGQSDAVTMMPTEPSDSRWGGNSVAYVLRVNTIPHPGASYGSTYYGVTMDTSYSTFVQGTGGPFYNEAIYIYSNSNRMAAVNVTNITLV